MRLLIIFVLTIIVNLACDEQTLQQPISDNEFIEIYAEYLFIITQDSSKDELRNLYLQNILTEQGKTLDEFSETWKVLNTKPERWQVIMNQVVEKMQEKRTILYQE